MAGIKGKINTKDLKKFEQAIKKMNAKQLQQWNEAAVKELATRLLARVIKLTPKYHPIQNDVNKHSGGHLQRNWTVGEIRHSGNTYEIEVINPVEYAPYVEFGHRGVYVPSVGKVLHTDKRYTEGKFMLTVSETELQTDAPKILMNKMKKFFGGVL